MSYITNISPEGRWDVIMLKIPKKKPKQIQDAMIKLGSYRHKEMAQELVELLRR